MASDAMTDSLRETLAVFDSGGAAPPQTTTEVAETLDLGRRSTYERLQRLVEQGCLETKKVGARGRVWWRPQARPAVGSSESPEWPAAAESLVDDVLGGADVGVFVLDENFDVAWLNGAAEDYFDLDSEGVLGRAKPAVVEESIAPTVADSERFADRVLGTYEENAPPEQFECHVTPEEGRTERWLEHRSQPIDSGAYAGGRVELYYDVTERKDVKRHHRADREQFERLVGAVEEYAIFMLDSDGRVQTWNEGARQIKGYEREEIIGEHFSTFYTDADREAGVPGANLAAAAADGDVEDEGWRVRADGERFWANVTISAIYDDDGTLQGYAKVTRDMTDRREREQRYRRERNLLEKVLETSPVGIGVFDSEGEAVRVNERFTTLLGRVDNAFSDYELGEIPLLDGEGRPIPVEDRPAIRALRTGESITDQRIRVENDSRTRHLSVNADLFDDGEYVVVSLADVTQLHNQTRRLKRQRNDLESELEEIFERVDDGFFALDRDLVFTYVNDRAGDLLEHRADSLIGEHIWDALESSPRNEAVFREALDAQEPVTFEEYYEPLGRWFETHVYPSESGLSVYFRDVSDRKERQRDLERYETIVDTVEDGIYAVDPDARFVMVNDAFCELTGYDREELLGAHATTVHDDTVTQKASELSQEVVSGERDVAPLELDLQTKSGEAVPVESRLAPFPYGQTYGRCGVVRDVSDRIERERKLQRRVDQQGVVTELGQRALEHRDLDELLADAAELVADTLGDDICTVFDLDPAADELLVRQGVGCRSGVVGSETVSATDVDSQVASPLRTDEPVVVSDFETASRFDRPALLTDHGVRSGISTVIGSPDDPWGVLGTYDGEPSEYSESDVSFVRTVATILSSAIARHRDEQQLERQREQLSALNNLNSVVRRINEAVIDQSSREEIERVVVESLAEADSYEFAWVGEVDHLSETVDLQVEAGVENYLGDVTISVDPDDDRSLGPTGRAVHTGEIQICQDVRTDPRYEQWREHAETWGYRSSAAIPISHEGTIYSVLNVYSERVDGFSAAEQEVVSQLGEVVGHAIAALERKQALISDEVVELGFRIRDVFEMLEMDADADGSISLEKTVSLGDGEYLEYGTATGDSIATLERMVDSPALPHWQSLEVLPTDGDETRFEVELSEPPVITTVASNGGYVHKATIEDGDYSMRIHLSPETDISHVVDSIREIYPDIEMVTRRQMTRSTPSTARLEQTLVEGLTGRQRTALEAAYHAGYFELPRSRTGEEVAESIGIRPPTFHDHLRKAEQRLLTELFEEK